MIYLTVCYKIKINFVANLPIFRHNTNCIFEISEFFYMCPKHFEFFYVGNVTTSDTYISEMECVFGYGCSTV